MSVSRPRMQDNGLTLKETHYIIPLEGYHLLYLWLIEHTERPRNG